MTYCYPVHIMLHNVPACWVRASQTQVNIVTLVFEMFVNWWVASQNWVMKQIRHFSLFLCIFYRENVGLFFTGQTIQ